MNAEIAAWAVLNSIVLLFDSLGLPEAKIDISWPDDRISFGQMLRRWDRGDSVPGRTYLKLFAHVCCPSAILYGIILFEADLRSSDLSGASVSCCFFQDANFADADLSGASCYRASFDNARMVRAQLQGMAMNDCILSGTDFTGSIGSGILVDLSTFATIDEDDLQDLMPRLTRDETQMGSDIALDANDYSNRVELYATLPEDSRPPFDDDDEV